MLNRDVFSTDPDTYPLANEGVAKLSFPVAGEQIAVLRGELSSFVCDGAYADGLIRIVERFCSAHASNTDIPGVWISGFFGSGKSHLAAMLGGLWENRTFTDGTTPESVIIQGLPAELKAALAELRAAAKRAGGVLVAGGTMGRGSNDPAIAVAELVLKAVGLPSDPRIAEVALWLGTEGILEGVRTRLGSEFDEELRTFALSTDLAEAILAEKPQLAPDADTLIDRLVSTFPDRSAVPMSVDAMESLIDRALRLGRSHLPLTLIILDELQQFLQQRPDQTLKVQSIAERLASNFKGRIMLVATGQQALTQVDYLQKLLDRFPVTVQLRETDIDSVIRKTVLAKKPEAMPALEARLAGASGEINRQLAGAKIRHTAADEKLAPLDWPLLPARRRLWEYILRELDSTQMRSSLRGQLRTTLDAARAYASRPLGTAVPTDFLYRSIASDAVNAGELPRETYERIETLRATGGDKAIEARVLALVFLLARIAGDVERHGVLTTADTIADLLIEDLGSGHSIRADVPAALSRLADAGAVIETATGWRLQTKESAEWDQQFKAEARARAADPSEATRLRRELMTASLDKLLADARSVPQGATKEQRLIRRIGPDEPTPSDGAVIVRQYNGYDASLKDVEATIAAAGVNDPTIYLLVPALEGEALSRALQTKAAAESVLSQRGLAATDDGRQAREAMQARARQAGAEANAIIDQATKQTCIELAGGAVVDGITPAVALKTAAYRAVQRLYDKFDEGDNANWGSAFAAAKAKDPAALKKVGFDGPPDQHSIGKVMLGMIGAGIKGADIRAKLAGPPYGWNGDAIDAMVLMLARDHLTVTDASGQPVPNLADLPRANIGTVTFRMETAIVSAPDRIKVRSVITVAGVPVTPSREADSLPDLFAKMEQAALAAGGTAPCPATPTVPGLDEARSAAGNARMLVVAKHGDEWKALLPTWKDDAAKIAARHGPFALLRQLVGQGANDQAAGLKAVIEQRALLAEPDPVKPLLAAAADGLRSRLNGVVAKWQAAWDQAETALNTDPNWAKLSPEQRHELRAESHLLPMTLPKVDTAGAIATALDAGNLSAWEGAARAVQPRLDDVRFAAARLLEPKIQQVRLSSKIIKDAAQLDAWLESARATIATKLADGPVVPTL